jgi:sugar O-acyltransferase (sialic acid O-acetyltransferase NeuD family)
MRSVAIYGAGGFGREVALMIKQIDFESAAPWKVLGFYDDGKPKGTVVDDLVVLGGLEDLNSFSHPIGVILAVADPTVRRGIKEKIILKGVTYPIIIHPSANIGDAKRNQFEEGVIIAAGNILTTSIAIRSFTIVNLHCTIGHDVLIGPFSTVMPGCSLSGSVDIGSEVLIGSGARILPGVNIGNGSKVGAGAVVLENVPSQVTVAGVPAKIVRPVDGNKT